MISSAIKNFEKLKIFNTSSINKYLDWFKKKSYCHGWNTFPSFSNCFKKLMEVFRIIDTNLFYETVFLEEQFFSQYVQVFDNISLYCDSTCISYVLGIPVCCKYLTELLERPQCQVWSMLNKCYKYYWIGFVFSLIFFLPSRN